MCSLAEHRGLMWSFLLQLLQGCSRGCSPCTLHRNPDFCPLQGMRLCLPSRAPLSPAPCPKPRLGLAAVEQRDARLLRGQEQEK